MKAALKVWVTSAGWLANLVDSRFKFFPTGCVAFLQGLLVYAICRADTNVCAEVRGQLKQQLVACIKASLKPQPIVIAAGSSAEDAAMMREATIGILMLQALTPAEEATYVAEGPAEPMADPVTSSENAAKPPVARHLRRTFLPNSRKTSHAFLPLLPEQEPGAKRRKSLPLPPAPENCQAPKGRINSMDSGLNGLLKQASSVFQQELVVQQHQQATQSTNQGPGRVGRNSVTNNCTFVPYMQAACLCGSSADVVLESFHSLCSLIFRDALFERAQSVLLIDQVIYSTSVLLAFLFAMLATNLLDSGDPTGLVNCIWFSLIAIAAACLTSRPMAAALDDEVGTTQASMTGLFTLLFSSL